MCTFRVQNVNYSKLIILQFRLVLRGVKWLVGFRICICFNYTINRCSWLRHKSCPFWNPLFTTQYTYFGARFLHFSNLPPMVQYNGPLSLTGELRWQHLTEEYPIDEVKLDRWMLAQMQHAWSKSYSDPILHSPAFLPFSPILKTNSHSLPRLYGGILRWKYRRCREDCNSFLYYYNRRM